MDPLQQAAFEGANNPALTTADTTFLLGGLLVVIALFWFAWVAMSAYKKFGNGGSAGDFIWSILRSMVITFSVLFIVGG